MKNTRSSGFTLLELLIVVAIIGILSSIALPAYQNSVLRSGRAEAKSELLQVAADQERYFSNFNTYVDDATPLNTPVVAGRDRTTQNGFYAISVAACGAGTIATCFLATATAQNDQAADACTTLTLSDTGARGATGDTTNECWQR
ncbi:MAG: type 4 fimbrial biogenesis protein PilE [Pseudohongiella sp.]|nr:MAG: type 4 fimbrial biogenesis protein PilE [Pseudohongiella sp.]